MGVSAEYQIDSRFGIKLHPLGAVTQKDPVPLPCRQFPKDPGMIAAEGGIGKPQQCYMLPAEFQPNPVVFQQHDPGLLQTLPELLPVAGAPGLVVAADKVTGRDLSRLSRKGERSIHIRLPGVDQIAGQNDDIRLDLPQRLRHILPESGVVQIGHLGNAEAIEGGGQLFALNGEGIDLQGGIRPEQPRRQEHKQDKSCQQLLSQLLLCASATQSMVSTTASTVSSSAGSGMSRQ